MPNNHVDLSVGLVRDWVPVTPSNDADNISGGLLVGFYVTVGGTITLTIDGNNRTITVPANFYIPCAGATRVRSTGTTATGIFALVI
jgi:hypothetical protein